MRLTRTVIRSFDQEIGAVSARLERHARAADQTAVAMELVAAAEFRKETERRHNEELKIQCERWLRPSDVKQVHLQQIQTRLYGTCDWITSINAYERWAKPGHLSIEDRLLIISGSHGCGKSILASSIVARLEDDDEHTLFYAFSNSDGSRQTPENLVRTFLWQLLERSGKKECVDSLHRLRMEGQSNLSKLWEAFGSMVLSLAKPVYCVVDGIDECADFDNAVSAEIARIQRRCPNLHMLLLGRPHATQPHSKSLGIEALDITSELLEQDIDTFIHNKIFKSDILSLPDLRENVYSILKDKSDGMFLWVRLMIDDLKKSSSRFEVNERLQTLPRGLENAYQLIFLRIFEKLDKFEIRLVQNALAFIIISYRPLHFDEF